MSTQDELIVLVKELERIEKTGQATVDIDRLIEHLIGITERSENIDSQTQNELTLANLSHRSASGIAMFQSVVESGKEALKALLIINGGAVVALLTFIGQIFSAESTTETVSMIAKSMYQFTWGLLCASAGFCTRYLSQSSYSKEKSTEGDVFSYASIGLGICSLLFFFMGALGTYHSLK